MQYLQSDWYESTTVGQSGLSFKRLEYHCQLFSYHTKIISQKLKVQLKYV